MKTFIGTKRVKWRVPNYVLYFVVLMFITTSAVAQHATFVDVTHEAGIRFQHSQGVRSSLLPEDMGSGAGFADIDNDGDLDLYNCKYTRSFQNNPFQQSCYYIFKRAVPKQR